MTVDASGSVPVLSAEEAAAYKAALVEAMGEVDKSLKIVLAMLEELKHREEGTDENAS